MTLTLGKKVIYPFQGLCVIGPVVKKVVQGRAVQFYHLSVLDDKGGDLYVPVDKIEAVGIRPLLKEDEIAKLLEHLKQPIHAAGKHTQRALDNAKLMASGSAFDLAEVVASLTQLRQTRALTFGEKRTLDRAKMLLICEISEVLRATRQEAEEQVDQALEARGIKISEVYG